MNLNIGDLNMGIWFLFKKAQGGLTIIERIFSQHGN